jgi:hypothetical protein
MPYINRYRSNGKTEFLRTTFFFSPDRYLGLLPPENYNKKSLHLLCGVLDQSKEGRISFSEFQTFEGKTGGTKANQSGIQVMSLLGHGSDPDPH